MQEGHGTEPPIAKLPVLNPDEGHANELPISELHLREHHPDIPVLEELPLPLPLPHEACGTEPSFAELLRLKQQQQGEQQQELCGGAGAPAAGSLVPEGPGEHPATEPVAAALTPEAAQLASKGAKKAVRFADQQQQEQQEGEALEAPTSQVVREWPAGPISGPS